MATTAYCHSPTHKWLQLCNFSSKDDICLKLWINKMSLWNTCSYFMYFPFFLMLSSLVHPWNFSVKYCKSQQRGSPIAYVVMCGRIGDKQSSWYTMLGFDNEVLKLQCDPGVNETSLVVVKVELALPSLRSVQVWGWWRASIDPRRWDFTAAFIKHFSCQTGWRITANKQDRIRFNFAIGLIILIIPASSREKWQRNLIRN